MASRISREFTTLVAVEAAEPVVAAAGRLLELLRPSLLRPLQGLFPPPRR